jgi:hypothetical protein
MRQLQNSKKGVTIAKAGVQKLLKRLDSRFRGNDNLGLLQLADIKENSILIKQQQEAPATIAIKNTCSIGIVHARKISLRS